MSDPDRCPRCLLPWEAHFTDCPSPDDVDAISVVYKALVNECYRLLEENNRLLELLSKKDER